MKYEVAQKRAKELLNSIDKEKYSDTYAMLNNLAEGWVELSVFWADIMESDKNYEIEPSVASFIEEMLLDEIAENNDDAMCDLGSLYYTGRIGIQDFEKAVHYYEMSAKFDNAQAQENLGYCYYYGRLGEVDYKKAYHYFVKGALIGRVNSLYKIGDMYKNGYYVEKDEYEAYHIYNHCSNIMSTNEHIEKEYGADICMRLADCAYNGIGTEKNLGLALYCYQKAEQLYYPRVNNGDFMYKKQYERAVEMQQVIREERKKKLPKYDWVKKEF